MSSQFSHVIAVFDEQADRRDDSVCLRFDHSQTSYGELRRRAQAIAAQLSAHGVTAGDVVAYQVERTADLLAVPLAILSLGAAYSFVDPTYPANRSRQILTHLAPTCLVTEASKPELGWEGHQLHLADVNSSAGEGVWPDGWRSTLADDPFHIVYTSGTTGTPRGVVVPHRAVNNRLAWMWQDYPFQTGDLACWHKSPALVASPWEMFGALLAGVPTRVLEVDTVIDPQALWQTLVQDQVTYFLAAPALIEGLLAEADTEPESSSLRFVSSSAEQIAPATVRRFHARFPGTVLLNMYGLSECASNVAAFDTRAMSEQAARVPIGRPIAGSRIIVVDGRLRPVPLGVEGEMLVGGDCLATGYLGDDELTAKRFITIDFGDGRPSRMYRTGDRARLLPDGSLEYMGRTDDQVQVRGFRVELGDIKVALEQHPGVGAAVVRARADALGGTRLVAYVEENGGALDIAELRRFAQGQLPQFMLPNEYVVLTRMPLTRSGKVDMAALDDIDKPADAPQAEYVAPRTPAEELIAGIWTEVLGRERVGVAENFFDIGGHSLLGTRMLSRVRSTFGVSLTVRVIFDRPTVEGLAEAVEEELINELESIKVEG